MSALLAQRETELKLWKWRIRPVSAQGFEYLYRLCRIIHKAARYALKEQGHWLPRCIFQQICRQRIGLARV